MAFEIDRQERDGVAILAPKGRMVLGEALEQMRVALEELFKAGHSHVVIDASHVEYIDSSALGTLVYAHTQFEAAGGAIILFGLNRRNIQLLVITRLATVFRIAPSELDAVNWCFPERESHPFDILSFIESQRKKKKGGRAE